MGKEAGCWEGGGENVTHSAHTDVYMWRLIWGLQHTRDTHKDTKDIQTHMETYRDTRETHRNTQQEYTWTYRVLDTEINTQTHTHGSEDQMGQ